ncbi:hypothetical protein FRX31_029699 [Thalictrum thalictroides]|uniref:At1g68980-like TPR repeats domain-containing protein n=1 Tax=Thalictrum thalictroides TaxID=46969 RepID=A0A7J6V6R7_THATH|nr:hypothetical protein FRX31_029699 [Thalictrum thalictroides]
MENLQTSLHTQNTDEAWKSFKILTSTSNFPATVHYFLQVVAATREVTPPLRVVQIEGLKVASPLRVVQIEGLKSHHHFGAEDLETALMEMVKQDNRPQNFNYVLNLVDRAGSERAAKTGVEEMRLRCPGIHIPDHTCSTCKS